MPVPWLISFGGGEKNLYRPNFQLYEDFDPNTNKGVNPIPGLTNGSGIGGWGGNEHTVSSTKWIGESFVAHYPNAVPVVKSAKIWFSNRSAAIGPLQAELWDMQDPNAPVVVGKAEWQVAEVPKGNQAWGWIVKDLLDPNGDPILLAASLIDSRRYSLVVKGDATTWYRTQLDGILATSWPATEFDTYMGSEAYAEITTDSGATWTKDSKDGDMCFALGVVIPGDCNGDGMVTEIDSAEVAGNLGNPGSWVHGDFDGDGNVTSADQDILNAHYWEYLPGVVIPEPATLSILALGGLTLLLRRRRSA
jgi:hypothetical protein